VLRLPAAAEALTSAGLPKINYVDGTDVPTLPTEALSVLPSTNLLVAFRTIVTAVRPAVGYRLVVRAHDPTTKADTAAPTRLRVHAALRRGDTDVETVTFDTTDFIPGESNDAGRPDAIEVTTTVVAAWLLVVLVVDLKLGSRRGLYGARNWRSVALQALAIERQNEGDRRGAQNLHHRSEAIDSENRCVTFNQIKYDLEATDDASLTPADLTDRLKLTGDLKKLTQEVEELYPVTPLALRCRYALTAQYLYDAQRNAVGINTAKGPSTLTAGVLHTWWDAHTGGPPLKLDEEKVADVISGYLEESARQRIRGDLAFAHAVQPTSSFTNEYTAFFEFEVGVQCHIRWLAAASREELDGHELGTRLRALSVRAHT
jgi:hypothetical protein